MLSLSAMLVTACRMTLASRRVARVGGLVEGKNVPLYARCREVASRASSASTASSYRPPPEVEKDVVHAPSATRPIARRVFCNRTLDLGSIKAVGFDCDYTLASYIPETFETLAHEQTIEKLIATFGYPADALRPLSFDPTLMVRGLVIDKEHGNVLKVDRHKYVKLAYHEIGRAHV